MTFSRREMLFGALAGLPGGKKTILLRSGWQTENIGDIAHTPGVLRLLELHLPDAGVILWSQALDRGVEAMLRRAFPRLEFVRDEQAAVREAFPRADFMIHGSGPGVVARAHLEAWRQATGKPYGLFGVTVTAQSEAASRAMDAGLHDLLSGARFVFTRETASLENLRRAGVRGPQLGFAPDGTFSLHVRDDARAEAFLRANGLEPKRFIAAVPRLRHTPYHKFRKMNWSQEEIRRRTEANERHAETDHSKMREAIVAWVRRTGGKALLCPEMTYELDIIRPLLFDPLPADVKARVVPRTDYWLPDEAASIYSQAAAVVSFECHSPIIAAANGTPCLYLHQPEDGIKGQMWADVGLGDWRLEIEQVSGAQVAERLLSIQANYDRATARVRDAVEKARRVQAEGMAAVRSAIGRL